MPNPAVIGAGLYAIAKRVSLPSAEQAAGAPWRAWIGGLFGAVYGLTAIVLAKCRRHRRLGEIGIICQGEGQAAAGREDGVAQLIPVLAHLVDGMGHAGGIESAAREMPHHTDRCDRPVGAVAKDDF